MIPKPYRLNLSATPFRGAVKHTPLFTLVTRPAISHQFAVRVSKKISSRAVVRNRLRRQLMFWFYEHRHQFASQQTLVIFRQCPKDLPSLLHDLEKLL